MDTLSHALIPVILLRVAVKNRDWPGRWGLVAVGIAGALPDLLTPHLSLESRLMSWSHGLPFWLSFSVIAAMAALASRRRVDVRIAMAASASYLLHILCDAVSGGVNFLYPWRNLVWGDYWVDPLFWIPLDIFCIVAWYWLFRISPALRQLKAARSPLPEPDPPSPADIP